MLEVHVMRRERYAFRCGRFRMSWRALRLSFFLVMALILVTLAIWRSIRQSRTVYDGVWNVALVIVGLLVPSF